MLLHTHVGSDAVSRHSVRWMITIPFESFKTEHEPSTQSSTVPKKKSVYFCIWKISFPFAPDQAEVMLTLRFRTNDNRQVGWIEHLINCFH